MGFDLHITLTLLLCPVTGKPYVYRNTKVYEIPEIEIPEHLRKYLALKGTFLYAYTNSLEQDGFGMHVSADTFLDAFPCWDDVEETLKEDEWSEEDHEGLKALVTWCSEQTLEFHVSWSY